MVAKFSWKRQQLSVLMISHSNDAKLVWYRVDGVVHLDLTRCGKLSKLFDMYYDRYGKGAVQKIDFGYGTVPPKLWGYKPKEDKKEKKMKDDLGKLNVNIDPDEAKKVGERI